MNIWHMLTLIALLIATPLAGAQEPSGDGAQPLPVQRSSTLSTYEFSGS